jgi:hypothetical protein
MIWLRKGPMLRLLRAEAGCPETPGEQKDANRHAGHKRPEPRRLVVMRQNRNAELLADGIPNSITVRPGDTESVRARARWE